MIYLQNALSWLYLVMMGLALIATLRHARLTKSSPLLGGGFGLLLAANIFSRLLPMIITRLFHVYPGQSFPTPITPFMLLSVTLSLIGACGWALIAFGLYSVLEEVSRKLALLQIAPQNSWNYQAAPNPLQGPMVQNQPVQSAFSPTYQPQNGPDQVREEAHASAFMSPTTPAPSAQDDRPAFPVHSEQSDAPLTLGASRQ